MTGADSVTSIACFNKSHEQQLQLRRVFCFARTLLQFYARVPLRTLSDPIRPRAAGSTSPSPRGEAARTAQPREALRRSLPCPALGAESGERGGGVAARPERRRRRGLGCWRRCRTAMSGRWRAARRAAAVRETSGGRSGTAAPTTASTATGAAGEGPRERTFPGPARCQPLDSAFIFSFPLRKDPVFFSSHNFLISCSITPSGRTFPQRSFCLQAKAC